MPASDGGDNSGGEDELGDNSSGEDEPTETEESKGEADGE